MVKKYRTPEGFKRAVEIRLKQEASRRSWQLNRLRQMLIFERFLARVFHVFGSKAIIKGGVVLELRLERARSTKDIDLRLVGSSTQFLQQLQEVSRLELDDHMQFECQEDKKHPTIEGKGVIYEGFRFRAQAFLNGKVYGSSFGIDVSFADALVGDAEKIQGTDFFSFAGWEPEEFLIYPLGSHIAEKLHAYTLPREHENSRVKDLPDLALLASVRELEGQVIKQAIEETFGRRGTHQIPAFLPEPPGSWTSVYSKMAMDASLPWVNMDGLFEAVSVFVGPLLSSECTNKRWSPGEWEWLE